MNIIQRLLVREDIDALELDLARAREHNPRAMSAIRAEIERLERLIDQSTALRRQSAFADEHSGRRF